EKFGRRSKGHIKGVESVRNIVRSAGEQGIAILTLWGFSSDNWKRPDNEINVLMGIFKRYIVREADELDAASVKVTFLGRRTELQKQLQHVMRNLEEQTRSNTGLHLQVALNYGGEAEIVDACNKLRSLDRSITGDDLRSALSSSEVGMPDLIIRTGGEMRTSGFFPLAVHAEWEFIETLWPDFTAEEFQKILTEFEGRERRFGGLLSATE
ncbi:polyprenyl diphosphate synthase, partial [Candidatus Pacebacteria bacterium]|nr:polyprenyl diphosphate synthase [Candidatus Paceibacterota bacterium]